MAMVRGHSLEEVAAEWNDDDSWSRMGADAGQTHSRPIYRFERER